MKFIGQFIQDFVARFRNDVYLEDISTGTIESGGNLGLDSNNKIVKATIASGSGDITAVTITTDSGGGSAASDTGGSADFSLLGASGVDVTNSGTTITARAVPAEIDHDSLQNFDDNKHFTQANITTVGTIGTGVWQGSAIATTYTAAKVTSIGAGDGIDIDTSTGDVTITAETAAIDNPGVVELATDTEAIAGSLSNRAVTPANLKARVSQIVNLKGYATLQDNVYDLAVQFSTDDEAPFQLDESYGSGTIGSGTEINQKYFFRANGFHVPFACTLSSLQIQVSCGGTGSSGDEVTVALVEYRPSEVGADQNDYPRTVYAETIVESNDNHNKIKTVDVADGSLASSGAIPAGSHLLIMVKGDSSNAGATAVVSLACGLSW